MRIRIAGFLAWLAICLVAPLQPAQAACPAGNSIADVVHGGTLCLVATTYGAAQAGNAPTLVVVVHGDVSSGGPADYHLEFTKSLAKPGVVAVALVRPGYSDAAGRTSEGTHYDRRDSYTPANIAAVGGCRARTQDPLQGAQRRLCRTFRRRGHRRRPDRQEPRFDRQRRPRLVPLRYQALAGGAQTRGLDTE